MYVIYLNYLFIHIKKNYNVTIIIYWVWFAFTNSITIQFNGIELTLSEMKLIWSLSLLAHMKVVDFHNIKQSTKVVIQIDLLIINMYSCNILYHFLIQNYKTNKQNAFIILRRIKILLN